MLAKAGIAAVIPIGGRLAWPAAAGVTPVMEQALPPVTMDGWEMTALEVAYAPGEVDKPHRHPGFVFGYVIEGTVRFQVDGQTETVYHAGQMFYEPPGSVHRVSGNASSSAPCRLLAMIFAQRGRPLSVDV
jgi:quercetin dioxygenase-like cupin family protein